MDSLQEDQTVTCYILQSVPGAARRSVETVTFLFFHLRPTGGALGFSSDVFIMDAVGGGDMNLGELADLTVANDNDLSMDVKTHVIQSKAQDASFIETQANSENSLPPSRCRIIERNSRRRGTLASHYAATLTPSER